MSKQKWVMVPVELLEAVFPEPQGCQVSAISLCDRALDAARRIRTIMSADDPQTDQVVEPTAEMIQAACAAFRLDIPPTQAMFEALCAAIEVAPQAASASFPPYQRCTTLEHVPVTYSSNTSQAPVAPNADTAAPAVLAEVLFHRLPDGDYEVHDAGSFSDRSGCPECIPALIVRKGVKTASAAPVDPSHRALIKNAIRLLRLRKPVAPDVERVACDLELMLTGHETPAGPPSAAWLEVAAIAEKAPAAPDDSALAEVVEVGTQRCIMLYDEDAAPPPVGTKLYIAPQAAPAAPAAPDVAGLVEALGSMTCAYRMAVQAGHARITALGGDCDSVERMLADFLDYGRAVELYKSCRAALAAHQQREGGGVMKRESVEAAKMKYQQAAKDYDAAAESAYPPGTIVKVQLGRAAVTLRSTGSRGSWWACPGQLCGVNVKTGKVRTFYADDVIQEASHDD